MVGFCRPFPLRAGLLGLALAIGVANNRVPAADGPSTNLAAPNHRPIPAQNPLFSDGCVTPVRIVLNGDALNLLRAEPRKYVRARLESADHAWREAAIRLKGSTGSFQPVDGKPSFTIDFARFAPGARFHGLSRVYLNNSVEDPGFLNEKLGAAVFESAGIPSARVGFARVWLNDRELGLYVLKEGFTREFLASHFDRSDGQLFDNDGGSDIDQPMHPCLGVKGSRTDPAQPPFAGLLSVLRNEDPEERWRGSETLLDRDSFLRFATLEIILGHRDGYCLARNNYRIYVEPPNNRLVFIPDGMDQLLGNPEASWQPNMAGLVASGLFASKEGARLYRNTLTNQLRTVFSGNTVATLVDGWVRALESKLSPEERRQVLDAALSLKKRAAERERSLWDQLRKPAPGPLIFIQNTARLAAWSMSDAPDDGAMDTIRAPQNGYQSLHIRANSPTAASWRTKARLERGRYRFEGTGKVVNVAPLPTGKQHGAALRILGRPDASQRLSGTTDWQQLSFDFQVEADAEDLEFMAELRANRGEFWLAVDSLRLVRVVK